MKKQGYISQKQYDKAMADDVYGRISEHNDVREETMNTYFVDAVIDDVFDDLVNIKGYSESEAYKAIYQGGLTIKSTQNLQIQKICDEEVADKANYDAGTKYSFYLSFQVKEKDGTIKTYTNQTMLSYYKKKNKSQNYSINFTSEEDCRAAIAQYEKDVLGKGDKLVENSEYIFITMQPQVAMTIDFIIGKHCLIGICSGEKRWHPCRMMHRLRSEIKHTITTRTNSEDSRASGRQSQNPSIL